MQRASLKIMDNPSSFFSDEERSFIDGSADKVYLGNSVIRGYLDNMREDIERPNSNEDDGTIGFKLFQKNEKIIPLSNIASENFEKNKNDVCYSLAQKEWQGYVENVSEENGEFTAVLKDKSGKESDIRVDFSIDEVNEGDRGLVQEGALIRWIIGKERKVHGQIKNNDYIVFQRFPVWQKGESDKDSSVVRNFNNWLNSENDI